MQTIKRTLCLLLTCVLLVGLLPMSALAAEGQVYEGTCGSNVTWVLDTSTGLLTISGSGPMKDYAYDVDSPMCKYRNTIKKIVVDSGVTHIGSFAFSSSAVTTVELPDTVTSIGEKAFIFCHKLETCLLPDSVTSIGVSAFSNCEKLNITSLPSSLTDLGNSAFCDCETLGPVLEIPQGVTDIGWYAFRGCANLETLILNEGLVTIDPYAFCYTNIQKLTIPSTVEKIDEFAFAWCDSLKFVDMKGGTELCNGAFHDCKSLEKVNFPATLLSARGQVFTGCKSLTYLYFPANVDHVGGWSFADSESLKTVCFANPECEIVGKVGVVGSTVIYGKAGSTAQSYAEQWGYSFKLLGSEPKEPADPVTNENADAPGQEEPVTPTAPQFKDVAADAYYAVPVTWAVNGSITNGTTATTFSPNATCTQCQILTFLYRAADSPAVSGGSAYTNSAVTPDQYYYKAMVWAYQQGVVTDAGLNPNAPCTRADVVTYLWRLNSKPAGGTASFTDVPSSASYAQAVSWAVKSGITNGTSATTFSPSATCTRGQIVTFLYRNFVK